MNQCNWLKQARYINITCLARGETGLHNENFKKSDVQLFQKIQKAVSKMRQPFVLL